MPTPDFKDLKLFETAYPNNSENKVTRVPGGWIFYSYRIVLMSENGRETYEYVDPVFVPLPEVKDNKYLEYLQ